MIDECNMAISFEDRDDVPAEDNVLTENKDRQRGNGGYLQRGHDQIVRIALLELIEGNHALDLITVVASLCRRQIQ